MANDFRHYEAQVFESLEKINELRRKLNEMKRYEDAKADIDIINEAISLLGDAFDKIDSIEL